MNEQEIREQICDVCHKMWQQGWVAANDGNVSVKIGEDLYLATPTGISKSFITPEKPVSYTHLPPPHKGRPAFYDKPMPYN